MQTRVPPDSLNRRLAPQGRRGDKQDSEEEEGGGGLGLEKRGKQVHGKDGRHLLHHVLGSHGDKTEHPPPPYSSRSGSTHSPRAHSMVADRRGWWAGFSSFAAAPHSCF